MNTAHVSLIIKDWIIIIMAFLLTGCFIKEKPSIVPTEIITQPTQISTLFKTFTPTMAEKTRTKTSTVSPSPTLEPPSSTPTPQPTLSAEESKSLLINLLENNGNCRLPCIWGQIPRETEIKTIDNFVARFGNIKQPNDFVVDLYKTPDGKYSDLTFVLWKKNVDNMSRVTINLGYPRNSAKVQILTFYAEADLESGEGVNLASKVTYDDPFFNQMLQTYMLPQILTHYGSPTTTLVLPYYDNPNNPVDYVVEFSLVLYYQEQGIYVEYLFPREKSGSFYKGCPSRTGTILLKTWDPNSGLSLDEIVKDKSVGINGLKYTKSIDRATTMTLDQFYQVFKGADPSACIQTPIKLWDQKNIPPTSTP